ILRAIPDLMFMLRRDGTYVDYHARDAAGLLVPPAEFLGRNVRDVMPAALADATMEAIERAHQSDNPVKISYELPMDGERRSFEARLTPAGKDRVLTIVRDVTETRRSQ